MEKEKGLGFLNAKKMPLRDTENISVFGSKMPIYFPQMSEGRPYKVTNNPKAAKGTNNQYQAVVTTNKGERYPLTTLSFNREYGLHPTQKPIALLEYLIKTYTNEGETVLDFTCGSGTTLIAALSTGRRAVGIEMDEKYCQITVDRIKAYYASKENKA